MKQSIKKKTPTKKAKTDQDSVVFNGTLVGTWKNSDIMKITFDSGAVIAKYGNDEYKPSLDDLNKFRRGVEDIAICLKINKDKVVVVNV